MAMHVMLRMVALVFLFLLALPARAGGADGCTAYIDAAPVVADQPGTWCLTNDLRTDASHDYAILIEADDVTVDCRGHLIDGAANAGAARGTGIGDDGSLGRITVRNCRVRGFRLGISLSGREILVEDNAVSGSIETGIGVYAHRSTIRRNRVLDLGSPDSVGQTEGIVASGSIDVLDNVVHGIEPGEFPSSAIGIDASRSGGSTIAGNRISGLPARAPGEGVYTLGIQLWSNTIDVIVRDNVVTSGGDYFGIRCRGDGGTAVSNIVVGGLGIDGCRVGAGNVLP